MSSKGTVFLVDDDPGALRSLCWLIEQADYQVRCFSSGKAFVESLNAGDEGCIVLDLRMPSMDGHEVQDRLQQSGIQLPIIFLTAYGDVQACSRAFRAKAVDFLEKPVDDKVLLESIDRAMAATSLRDAQETLDSRLQTLTAREKEVFDLIIQGRALKQISMLLGVSVQTVWRHRNSILKKTATNNEVELVRLAVRSSGPRHS